jgi:hypothetical protein
LTTAAVATTRCLSSTSASTTTWSSEVCQ